MKSLILILISIFIPLSICFPQYIFNAAANFNGINSYISVPDNAQLNPTTAITLEAWVYPVSYNPQGMEIIGKSSGNAYHLGIQHDGRVVFKPRLGTPFKSKVSSIIPLNSWTHIAASYRSSETKICINGIFDTSTFFISGPLIPGGDSLFIGAEALGFPTQCFHGQLDNIRIWGKFLSTSDIARNMYIPLQIHSPTGIYSQLIASFQMDNDFLDFTGNTIMSGNPRNCPFINYHNKSVNHMNYNGNLVLNGTTDYLSFNNIAGSGFNPTSAITLEAWLKRDTTGSQPMFQNIVNKSGGSNRYDYSLSLNSSGQLKFSINSENYFLQSAPLITNAQWTYVSASYNSYNSRAILYINGDSVAGATFGTGTMIQNNPDSLFIGGIGASLHSSYKFKGQIDGVRIWSTQRNANQIKENMYKVIYYAAGLTNFNFDKYTNGIFSNGSTIFGGNNFAGAAYISSSHLTSWGLGRSTSPILFEPLGFYIPLYANSFRRFFVPGANLNGIKDSVYISSSGSVGNLNAYLLLSTRGISDIKVQLISPSGTSVTLFQNSGGIEDRDLFTIFSDAADSVAGIELNGFGITAPFSPEIKPHQPLSLFNGQNMQGWWKLKVISIFDIGYVHGWGLNITDEAAKILKLTSYIQGFYNSSINGMTGDTAIAYLRNANSPYSILDTSKSFLNFFGAGNFTFTNIMSDSTYFYIVVKHRNSLETWSSSALNFTADTLNYDFTPAASLAFGNNQIQIDDGPVEFGIYGGDVSNDGVVDATDLSLIDNDAFNFTKGYVNTDLTGNNFVDASDAAIADNNAFNFVMKITP